MRLVCHLREIRGRRSIRDLAEASKINRGDLSMIELGRRLPKDDQVEQLERAYGQSIAEWYEWRGPLVAVQVDDGGRR